jgi:hypothetical protein
MSYPLISGQKTVAAAGTAEALGSAQIDSALLVKALDTNTGIVAIGNDGANDVTVSNGYRLAAGEQCILDHVDNLAAIYIDAAVNGEGVSWLKLDA